MSLRDFFGYHIFNIAILWNFADFYMGDVVVTFLGLPFVFLGRLMYAKMPADYFFISSSLLFWFVFFVTLIGLKVVPAERFQRLLLPKVYGFILSLFLIKTKFLNYFVLGLLYNGVHAIVMKYFLNKNLVQKIFQDVFELNFLWEKLFVLFSVAVSSAIISNFLYQFLRVLSAVL